MKVYISGRITDNPKMDLTGKKFGMLTVIGEGEWQVYNGGRKRRWLCECECGNKRNITTYLLVSGDVKSCGCKKKNTPKTFVDLTGKRFGRLVVTKRVDDYVSPKGYKSVKWECKCDCGNNLLVAGHSLKNGKTVSCGCLRKINTTRKNMKGKTFGELTVLEYVGNDSKNKALWKCLCSCGRTCIARGADLRNGAIKTCGHLKYGIKTMHGNSHTRLYRVWRNIKSRCYCEYSQNYKNYGGRGITICDEWLNDFMSFYNWAYANGYDENAKKGQCTIDRIDNDKGYSPDNCRWVSASVQSNNKRTNKFVTYNGETFTISQLAKKTNISCRTLRARIDFGIKAEEAVNMRKYDKYIKHIRIEENGTL